MIYGSMDFFCSSKAGLCSEIVILFGVEYMNDND